MTREGACFFQDPGPTSKVENDLISFWTDDGVNHSDGVTGGSESLAMLAGRFLFAHRNRRCSFHRKQGNKEICGYFTGRLSNDIYEADAPITSKNPYVNSYLICIYVGQEAIS